MLIIWQKPTPYCHYPSVKNKDKIKNKNFMVKKVEPYRKNTSTKCINLLKQFSATRQIVQSGECSPEPSSCTLSGFLQLAFILQTEMCLSFSLWHPMRPRSSPGQGPCSGCLLASLSPHPGPSTQALLRALTAFSWTTATIAQLSAFSSLALLNVFHESC